MLVRSSSGARGWVVVAAAVCVCVCVGPNRRVVPPGRSGCCGIVGLVAVVVFVLVVVVVLLPGSSVDGNVKVSEFDDDVAWRRACKVLALPVGWAAFAFAFSLSVFSAFSLSFLSPVISIGFPSLTVITRGFFASRSASAFSAFSASAFSASAFSASAFSAFSVAMRSSSAFSAASAFAFSSASFLAFAAASASSTVCV